MHICMYVCIYIYIYIYIHMIASPAPRRDSSACPGSRPGTPYTPSPPTKSFPTKSP